MSVQKKKKKTLQHDTKINAQIKILFDFSLQQYSL